MLADRLLQPIYFNIQNAESKKMHKMNSYWDLFLLAEALIRHDIFTRNVAIKNIFHTILLCCINWKYFLGNTSVQMSMIWNDCEQNWTKNIFFPFYRNIFLSRYYHIAIKRYFSVNFMLCKFEIFSGEHFCTNIYVLQRFWTFVFIEISFYLLSK